MSFLLEAVGREQLANQELPSPCPSAKQKNATACGFYVLANMEEGYRWLRGEGVYRLPEDRRQKAADLTRWNASVAKAVFQPGERALARQAAVAAVLDRRACCPTASAKSCSRFVTASPPC